MQNRAGDVGSSHAAFGSKRAHRGGDPLRGGGHSRQRRVAFGEMAPSARSMSSGHAPRLPRGLAARAAGEALGAREAGEAGEGGEAGELSLGASGGSGGGVTRGVRTVR